jgi:D-proline reductase (dithiol) PrdB
MAIQYIELMSRITSSLPPLPIAEMGQPALTALNKPLSECRVMIVSSAGVHLAADAGFKDDNDMTFRRIPQDVSSGQLRISHPSPARRAGEADINVVHPYERLAELADEGFIGDVSPYHLAISGGIKKLTELVTELAPAMAADASDAEPDLLLVVPLCPACHQSVGLVARVLERAGLPTVSLTCARDITARIRPPRSAFLNYPVGNSTGRTGDAAGQRDVLRAALSIAALEIEPGTIVDLPFQWPDPNWEAETTALYEREASVVLEQRSKNEYEFGENYAVRECGEVCSLA